MSFSTPIAVDLDGSLIHTDILYETFVRALFRHPWCIFMLLPWLLKGKAHLKMKLAALVDFDIAALPYNQTLIDYLQQQKHREIILCTATNEKLAQNIAGHLGFFHGAIGSTATENLTGSAKAKVLCDRYGEGKFSYVGNEKRDLKIWKYAASAIVVERGEHLARKISTFCPVEHACPAPTPTLKVIAKALRLHQWVKNILLFVPLLTSHQFMNPELIGKCLLAFLSFGLCASATYLANDLSDLDSDRVHWKKKFRPLAAGTLSIRRAIFIMGASLPLSLILAAYISPLFLLALIVYIVLTLAYSFLLKRLQTVDIITLASLYTLRIVAGGFAVSIQPSFWLLAFSMFLFLCLALVKRISEILKTGVNGEIKKLSGRGYYTSDIQILNSLATASGMLSILVFAMYLNSQDVMELYQFPHLLWLVCPLLLYWIVRILIMSSRGEIDEDPIVFALKDRRSWLAGFIIGIILLIAI
jgi:4-hydroxybenzoate polyprenyltransferase and related prenyltransferases